VKENFYRALYLRKRLGLSREVEGLNRRLRDASMQRFQAGEAPKIEANLAIARHVQSSKETLAAERDHQNAVRDLERLTGNEPTGETGLAGNLDVLPVEVGMERLVQVALQARPDLRARQVEIDRVKAETALTRRLIAPNTIIRGVYEEEAEVTGERDWIAGGTLGISLPLFDRKQAELSALAAEHSRARHQRTDAMLSVQNEVRNAYWTYDAARKATQLFEVEALESVSEGYRLIETAYREGKIGLVDLVVVQNDLVGAQLSYLDSLWDYWAAHVALERAVGQPLEREAWP
jgi:cobalt-zinc-cadmium efflux system outer membrane protein